MDIKHEIEQARIDADRLLALIPSPQRFFISPLVHRLLAILEFLASERANNGH